VVEDEQLHQGQGLGAAQVGGHRELAQPPCAEVGGEVHPRPDRLFDGPGLGGLDPPRDPQDALAVALSQRQAVGPAVDEGGEVGMRQPVAQGQLGVEVVVVAVGSGQEGDEHVGVVALGPDEGLGVGLAAIELGQDLVGGVAAARAIARHLPAPAQLLGRGEEHAHVVDLAHGRPVVAEQALDDREALGAHVHRRPEGAVLVAVDGLEDRVAPAQVREMLGDDVHVVAVRVQGRDLKLGPLAAVVAVVVVGADVGHVLLAQDAHQAAADRRLAARRVADDTEDDRARHHATSWASMRVSSRGVAVTPRRRAS
jgi:hypothetical protein